MTVYSQVSIKRPAPFHKKLIVLFYLFNCSIKQPGLNFLKKFLLNKHAVLSFFQILKSFQNKKAGGTRQKSSSFLRKNTAFLLGTSNFFGLSYLETALEA